MFNFFKHLFSTDFMPHVFCLREPGVVALHAMADSVIAIAYFLIPAALLLLLRRRRDLAFPWMFGLFGVFILGCGATHALGVVTLWYPIYRFDGVLKAVTALASIGTAAALFRLLPQMLLIPSAEQLRIEIRERKRAEQEVRGLNEHLERRVAERTKELEKSIRDLSACDLRLQAIVDGTSVLVCVKNVAGRYTFVNKAFTQGLGLSRECVIGHTDADLFPADLAARYKENDRRAMKEGPTEFEEVVRQGDKETIYLSNKFPLFDPAGRVEAICIKSTDITQRKRAEEGLVRLNQALRDSEERFRQIAELVPNMLWSAELNGQVRFMSQQFQRYTNAGEQLGDRVWQQLVHPHDVPALEQEFAASAVSRESCQMEVRLRGADGGYRWFLSRTAPVCGDDRVIKYWLGSFSDIDEIKRTEQALRRSNEELEQFAYAAAHDLQEPLRNISISLGMVRRQFGRRVSDEEAEWFEVSIKNASRMQAMVQDLLQYSRVWSDQEQKGALVDTATAAQQALQNLSQALLESEAKVEVAELPIIPMHEPHIVMLFQNLIGNAIKYRKPGTPPLIRISAHTKEDGWEFAVADNGIGFDPAYADRIFKVFKRLHGRDEYTGNGIGLAVCARIVAHYGGRIWAEAQPGEGATFHFTV